MLEAFGYSDESWQCLSFLKGVGEYDSSTKQNYFTLRDIGKFHTVMVGKGAKGKFETDFDFHEFLFKSISHND